MYDHRFAHPGAPLDVLNGIHLFLYLHQLYTLGWVLEFWVTSVLKTGFQSRYNAPKSYFTGPLAELLQSLVGDGGYIGSGRKERIPTALACLPQQQSPLA